MSLLHYFITSKTKRKLLRLFLEDSNQAFYTREIARLTEEPLNAVRRELSYLENAGLLTTYMQGNQKYHVVNPDFPLLAEWRKIVLEPPDIKAVSGQKADMPFSEAVSKSLTADNQADEPITVKTPAVSLVADMVEILRALFSDIDSINMAIIHGQSALSERLTNDGIDLLVVGDINKENLLELIVAVEEKTLVPVNLCNMSRSSFDYRNARGDPLIRRIWSEKKLVVKGRY